MNIEIKKEMQYDLLQIIEKPLELIKNKTDSLYRDHSVSGRFKHYIEEANKFFHEHGCETRTSHFILKRYYPKKGSWKFHSRRTSGLVWLQYDEDRWRSKSDSLERYWVGIPKQLALKILEANKFPITSD